MSDGLVTCANCGFTSEVRFKDDICPECGQTFWKCEKCGYLVSAPSPPEVCPSCNNKCLFKNVTCYTPECGGHGVDPGL